MSTRINPTRTFLTLMVVSVSVAAVLGASPHYKRGSPQCGAGGTTGTRPGAPAGLGNDDVVITVSLAGDGPALLLGSG